MTLSYQQINDLITTGQILGVTQENIQPASLDVPLTSEVYRMPGSILPKKGESVRQLVHSRALYQLQLHQPLELGNYYLVRCDMRLALNNSISGSANNKSSSGRINLQGRLLVDGISQYDTIPYGYHGEVWLEVHPELCPILLDFYSVKNCINQIRFRHKGHNALNQEELIAYHEKTPILYHPDGTALTTEELEFSQDGRGLLVGVELNPKNPGFYGIRRQDIVLDLKRRDVEPSEFFGEVKLSKHGLLLKKDQFYILGSMQRVSNPLDVCITMLPFQSEHGEFRSHFAGFFDPGNGYGDGSLKGFSVTMEVIPMEDAIEIRAGQPMFSIQVEPLDLSSDKVYGQDYPSNYYCNDKPRLAKYFKGE